ncbi:MAG: hypothetical protein GY759_17315 [Chloroflexi bacterium]|nr:hypothetical protein [Chloroflexota bacterium]
MTVFLQFIADNSQYVYALAGLVALFYLRRAIVARRERRSAIFPLEREVAMGRIYRTFGVAVLLLIIIASTWAAGNLLLPQLAKIEGITMPQPDDILVLIDTPTPTLPAPTATPTATPTVRARPTRIPPTVQVSKPTPAVIPPFCPIPGVDISSPGDGQAVAGQVAVIGTANIEGYQFYKLEWAADANPGVWNWFAGGEHPAVGAVLGTFSADLPSGRYSIRLVVVDITGNYPEPCIVHVNVP